jgi:hypothetical protein
MFLSRLKYLLSPLIKMLFLNGAGRWLKRTIYLFFKRFLLQSIRAGRLSFLYPHALVLGQLYEDKQLLQITLKAAASRRVPLNNAQIRLAHNVLGDIKKGQDYSAYKEYEVFYQVFQQKAFRSIESALNTGCKSFSLYPPWALEMTFVLQPFSRKSAACVVVSVFQLPAIHACYLCSSGHSLHYDSSPYAEYEMA